MAATFTKPLQVNGRVTAVRVRVAMTWRARAIGLLTTRQLQDPAGLWIKPCNSVHMFGMRFPLDIVFLDEAGKVLAYRDALKPWRAAMEWRAACVLELRVGLRSELDISVGSTLALEGRI